MPDVMWNLAAVCLVLAPAVQDPAVLPVPDRIRVAAFQHSEVMDNLAWLSDRIGPRLTGTPQMQRASEWTKARFEAYGLKARLEPFEIARGWRRVRASARIVEPVDRAITIAAGGWTPSTDVTVRARVVDLGAAREAGDGGETASRVADSIVLTAPLPWQQRRRGNPFGDAAAVLVDSQKPHALLNMTSLNFGKGPHEVGDTPAAFVASEDFGLLRRLCASGEGVVVELAIENQVTDDPITVHNTVAEIAGVGPRKGEIVVAGAHLDSWDLGSGTTDNGTGSMVVLEAARILSGLGERPDRTIRFVLFAGEEQGLVGSERYVERHGEVLDAHAGGVVMDIGTGALRGLSLHNQTEWFELVEQWFEPVRDLGFQDSSVRRQGGSDHLSFQRRGIPVFAFIQDPAEYFLTHHTQSDTWDKASEQELMQAACVMATGLWAMANHDGEIPRFDPELEKGMAEQPRLGRDR